MVPWIPGGPDMPRPQLRSDRWPDHRSRGRRPGRLRTLGFTLKGSTVSQLRLMRSSRTTMSRHLKVMLEEAITK